MSAQVAVSQEKSVGAEVLNLLTILGVVMCLSRACVVDKKEACNKVED